MKKDNWPHSKADLQEWSNKTEKKKMLAWQLKEEMKRELLYGVIKN